MGTFIKQNGTVTGAGFPKDINFIAPQFGEIAALGAGILASLVGSYTLGGEATATLRNHATGLAELTKVGTPVPAGALPFIGATLGGATVGTANAYETAIQGMAECTMLCVAKPMDQGNVANVIHMVSNYNSPASPLGDALAFGVNSFGVWVGNNATSTFRSGPSLAGADTSKWNQFVGRIKADGKAQAWWGHGGAVAAGAESGALTRTVAPRNFRIGYPHISGWNGTNPVAYAALFNRALTDAEVTAVMAYMRGTWGPALGIADL